MTAPAPAARDDRPWWRYPMLWLVVGGPLAVVVASLITAVVAARGQDPVLSDEEKALQQADPRKVDANTPAITARNHQTIAKH